MPITHEYGVGQSILDELAETEDQFAAITIWGDELDLLFYDLGLCSLDVLHVLRHIEDAFQVQFPDNTLEIATSPLALLVVTITLLNERIGAL
jgi:acyl carrier protein